MVPAAARRDGSGTTTGGAQWSGGGHVMGDMKNVSQQIGALGRSRSTRTRYGVARGLPGVQDASLNGDKARTQHEIH